MTAPPRAWRSLLFIPAHVPRFLARAHERGADGIILDMEDAVPPEERPAARATLAASIALLAGHGLAALVRVNHGVRHLAPDLEAAVRPGLSALVLPKVEEPGFVREVAEALAELEPEHGLPAGSVRLLLQVETPAALFALPAIAGAHPRVAAITLGPEDFSATMGGAPSEALLLGPNLAVLAAARAAGVQPMGFVGSIADYADLDAYAARIAQARQLGFTGAIAIHPAQVAAINAGFALTAAERDWARRVVEGAAAARREGRGAFRLDGKMVDPPVLRRAEQMLAG